MNTEHARLKLCLEMMVVSLVVTACGSSATYIWVDDLTTESSGPTTYYIQPADMVAILVWNQEQLSGSVLVRDDGQATMPLVGDIPLAGLTTAGAAEQIARRLEGLVLDPKVTVTLEAPRVLMISVLGEVRESGTYEVRTGSGLLDALARAGGLTEFASDDIYLLRLSSELQRIRISYRRLSKGLGEAIDLRLRDGDVIVVE